MKKIILISIPLSLMGCSTLDVTSDFSDSVKRVENKQSYQLVVGKTLTPETVDMKGGQLVKSSLEFNYVAPIDDNKSPDSYVTMELIYFKNYGQFSTALLPKSIEPFPSPAI